MPKHSFESGGGRFENPPSQSEKIQEFLKRFREGADLENKKEIIRELYKFVEDLFAGKGIELSSKVGSVYSEMAGESEGSLLLRQERIDSVTKLVIDEEAHSISGKKPSGKLYANAAAYGPNGEGTGIAFQEGRTSKYGLAALVGFNPKGLEIRKIPPSECELRDRSLCRSISGNLEPESIRQIIMRAPRDFFPEERMTPEEKTAESFYIFRGASITQRTP